MNSRYAFRLLDQLNTELGQTMREVRFVVDLVEAIPSQSITIDSDGLAAIMARIARQLEGAREMVSKEVRAMRAPQ